MRWTTVRALCRRLTVAAVTLTMVTGSLPAGAFAETLTTDSTFVQTNVEQADDAASADSDDAQTSDSASADPAPDAGAADPTALDTGDTPTPPDSEIASAAGLTGAGQTESTPAGTLATDLVEGKELAEQQKQEETSGAEATWNEELELWMTSKGATGVKGEYMMATWPASRPPRSTTSRSIASPTKFLSSMATQASPRWRCPRPSTAKMS